jgi:hypothetical protein
MFTLVEHACILIKNDLSAKSFSLLKWSIPKPALRLKCGDIKAHHAADSACEKKIFHLSNQ